MARESTGSWQKLDELFPVRSAAAEAILDLLGRDLSREWHIDELIAETHLGAAEMLTALARLTFAEAIDQPAAGLYRAKGKQPRAAG